MKKKPLDPAKQFNAWMRNTLRRTFFRWWERSKAVQCARVERGLYKCAACIKISKIKGFHVDHISPVVDPKVGFINWDIYIARLFCDASNLQLLCEECHALKTAKEREERKLYKTGPSSDASRQKLSASLKGLPSKLKGIPRPEEVKEKISASKLGTVNYTRHVIGKNPLTGATCSFGSIKKAAENLALSASHISEVCSGKREHVGGWSFSYEDLD